MASEEKVQGPHRLTMDERRSLWMNGVEEVESFDEETVAVKTVKGRLTVRGTALISWRSPRESSTSPGRS